MKKTLAIIITSLLAVTVFTAFAFSTNKNVNLTAPAAGNDSKPTVAEVLSTEENKTTIPTKADSQKNEPEAAPQAETTTVKNSETQPANNANKSNLSKEDAKAAALAHAGVKEADIRNYKIEIDKERNTTVYEIEFDAGNYEYDYIINVETGKIIHSEVEKDREKTQVNNDKNNTAVEAPTQAVAEAKVTKEEAKAAALAHAGLAENEISRFKAELDRERNGLVYEIEFESGRYEYEYEVSAENGKVLKFEKEIRD